MTPPVDTSLPPEFREELLAEVKAELPAFLHGAAAEQHDPVGDITALLDLEDEELEKVTRTHLCLEDAVLRFGASLAAGLRHPISSSSWPPEVDQAVRGPVDWSATIAQRSLRPTGTTFVVRPARRHVDVPESRALVWTLDRLQAAARTAVRVKVDPDLALEGGADPTKWRQRIMLLASQLARARATPWLRDVQPEPPDARTVRRLAAGREPFYARTLVTAIEAVRGFQSRSPEVLSRALCRRYFEPSKTWLLFEVCVALRLARAFREANEGRPRKTRLLAGPERKPAYARFAFTDGAEVSLFFQGWPGEDETSRLEELGERHAMKLSGSRPDLLITRTGPQADSVVLELKASREHDYLSQGLRELLGYVADRGSTWSRPAGWLVAPPSATFAAAPAAVGADLWIVSSDEVAAAAVKRFLPQGGA